MAIVIKIVLALLMTHQPVVTLRSDERSVVYVRDTEDFICLYRWEDGTISVNVGRDADCSDPDQTDIDVWQSLGCNGQYEEDKDSTTSFYYKCMYFRIHATYVAIVQK
jgi:hypothetical protein